MSVNRDIDDYLQDIQESISDIRTFIAGLDIIDRRIDPILCIMGKC